MLKDLTVVEFTEELASSSPAPGGGSVSALSAALASALSSMVFNLTIGKKFYNDYSQEQKELIQQTLNEVNILKQEFLDIIDKDANAFLEIMSAFKLPKGTEEETRIRKQKIEEGYNKALEIPFTLAKKSIKIYDCILTACSLGNPNAASDIGVAALLLQTAIEGAILNVKINLSSIKDEEYKKVVMGQCELLLAEGLKKKEDILKIINSKIG